MMGKKPGLVFGIVIVAFLVFAALAVSAANPSGGDAALYFPIKSGNTWIYQVNFDGVAQSYKQKVKATEPEDGVLKVIVYDQDGNPGSFYYYVQNEKGLFKIKLLDPSGITEYKPIWQVLAAKMNVGAAWKWESADGKMKESAKVIAAEKVTVSAGTFDTILIQSEGNNPDGSTYVDKTWYAKGIGYVKDELTINKKTAHVELLEYQIAK